MYEVTIKKIFSAAHRLDEIGGSCEKLHGHNFLVEVSVASPSLSNTGLLIDFRDLKGRVVRVLETLDHKCLNDIPALKGLNPSAENVARFIYDSLSATFKDHAVSVSKVTVWESDDAKVTYS
jgi:6-pyruvoyltetrahydropterin/6-carboxytetrahydropterin synthase